MTCQTRGLSLSQLVEDLEPYLNGWRGYFGFCQTPRVLRTWGICGFAEDCVYVSLAAVGERS